MVACFVFMAGWVQIYRILIRCGLLFLTRSAPHPPCVPSFPLFSFGHVFSWNDLYHLYLSLSLSNANWPTYRRSFIIIRFAQSTENRRSHTTDRCVTSYGPTLTVKISPEFKKPSSYSLVVLRYPRLGTITSRSRLSFWCRYNEKLCS